MPEPQVKQLIIDELTAVCNSLGKLDENDGTYMKDRDCKACLREIMRYLNADKEPFIARTFLGELNLIKLDLIPLLVQYCDFNDGDSDLFATILRLCTNLTSTPSVLFENQEAPTELEQQQTYNKLVKCTQNFKEAFANHDEIWSTLNVHLRHSLEDEITFERLIILIRNILQIPDDSSADSHDMCLYRMDKSGMLDTIIKVACETNEYCFHILEITYFMLRDQNPETLAKARSYKQDTDSDALKKRFAELSARAKRERKMDRNVSQLRFRGAAFVVQNLRTSSHLPMIVHQPSLSRDEINFDKGKTELRKAKNKKPLSSETPMIASDRNIKTSRVANSLRGFCKLFVEKIYNTYMQQIKHNLIQKRTQDEDESYYLWAIQFFIKFAKHSFIDISNISETISTSSLHYIQILMNSCQDKLKIEKKKFHEASKKLHLAIRAYREILYLMKSIEPESDFARTVETIQRNIFTETEYSTIILNLFQQYEEQKHSLHYLEDLILTNHIFLELLEAYSKANAAVYIDKPEEVMPEEEGEEKEEGEAPEDPTAKKKRKTKKKKGNDKKAEFRTAHFASRYCCPDVIRAYMNKLRNFKNNEDQLNLAILRFLERMVYDCKQEVVLFQASTFKCLLEIMSYDSSLPGHERFVDLGKQLMGSFGRMANKRRWMFQELLFWKTFNDCVEIENAVDPPVMPIHSPVNENADDKLDEGGDELPADTIADLKAELANSSDSDWDDEVVGPANGREKLPAAGTIDDLRAELCSSPDSVQVEMDRFPDEGRRESPPGDSIDDLRAELADSPDIAQEEIDDLPELDDDSEPNKSPKHIGDYALSEDKAKDLPELADSDENAEDDDEAIELPELDEDDDEADASKLPADTIDDLRAELGSDIE